jgi:hypothetical protein
MMLRCSTLLLVVTTFAALWSSSVESNECCDACIGKTAVAAYDYDPIVFEQCSDKSKEDRVCCFDCGSFSKPGYGEEVTYAKDGVTPQIKAGEWVKMEWANVDKVTYLQFQKNQRKIDTPSIKDLQADKDKGYFFICAKTPGSVFFRGWGKKACREATPEYSINVLEGEPGASCGKAPDAPALKNAGPGECNLNRASIQKGKDGKLNFADDG